MLTLPMAANTTDKPDTADQTVVAIDGQSQFYVNALEVSEADLPTRLQNVFENMTERTVYLKGDQDAPYWRHHGDDGRAAEGRDRHGRPHHGKAGRRQAAKGDAVMATPTCTTAPRGSSRARSPKPRRT